MSYFTNYRREKRKDPAFREKEKERERKRIALVRADPERRAAYNKSQSEWQKKNKYKCNLHAQRRRARLEAWIST